MASCRKGCQVRRFAPGGGTERRHDHRLLDLDLAGRLNHDAGILQTARSFVRTSSSAVPTPLPSRTTRSFIARKAPIHNGY